MAKILRHPLSPVTQRTVWAIAAIVVVMSVGTIGMKLLTGWRWIDSFYFMSMIATAEGPSSSPPNFWAELFASIMAFVSVGTLITAIGTIFGPYLGYLFHKGVMFAEREFQKEEEKRRALKTQQQEEK